ncbi:MAG: T9SS type A sorting domain-containing protein, partial [Candidatus Eisenbacteria bacterium]
DPGYVFQWDGSRWLSMGTSVGSGTVGTYEGPAITAMATWQDALYLGGRFRYAGSAPSFRIARWEGRHLRRSEPTFFLRAAPNPASESVTAYWYLDGPGSAVLKAFDIRGRERAGLASRSFPGGENSWTWDLRGGDGAKIPPGVYFLRLEAARGSSSRKVVIVR